MADGDNAYLDWLGGKTYMARTKILYKRLIRAMVDKHYSHLSVVLHPLWSGKQIFLPVLKSSKTFIN